MPLSAGFEVDRDRGEAPFEVHFRNFSVGRIELFFWEFGDGTHSREREARHVYTQPGRYEVSLVVQGPDGSHRSVIRDCVYVEASQGG